MANITTVLTTLLRAASQIQKTRKQRLRQNAEAGDADAQFELGCTYYDRSGGHSIREAIKWFRNAAEQGHAKAQHNMGVIYYNGEGIAEDPEEAIWWYRKAAEQGLAISQLNLGTAYYEGKGVELNDEEAERWWSKAAKQRNRTARNNLKMLREWQKNHKHDVGEYGQLEDEDIVDTGAPYEPDYAHENVVEQDNEESVKHWRTEAEQGDAFAQFELGEAYYYGKGVEQDFRKAVYWLSKANEQGHDFAYVYLDRAKVSLATQEAAERGDADAQVELGFTYIIDVGLGEEDREKYYNEKAVPWFRKAAEQGHARGQSRLGFAYYYGDGVNQDFREAVKWFKKAAKQGNADAQNNLGEAYENGNGVPQHFGYALHWRREAAEQGHEYAQIELGRAYRDGAIVEKDLIEAYTWFGLASG